MKHHYKDIDMVEREDETSENVGPTIYLGDHVSLEHTNSLFAEVLEYRLSEKKGKWVYFFTKLS